MQVVTGAEMQVIEKKAFAEIGISPLVVMENAGSRIVQVLKEEYGPTHSFPGGHRKQWW